MVKKLSRRFICAFFASVLLAFSALAQGAGETAYRNTTAITDNLSYVNTISDNSVYGREESYALELAGSGDARAIVMACDTIYGGMTISEVCAYAEGQGYNVLGAMNTDFFYSTKIPTGVVVENSEYRSSPEGNSVFGIGPEGEAFISTYPYVTISMENRGGGTDADNADSSLSLIHLNKTRATGGLYLYSSAFSTVSTRTTTDGWAVRMKILSGSLTVSGSMTLEVEELIEGSQAAYIGDGYLVLTADTASNMYYQFEKFAVGDRIELTTTCDNAKLRQAQWATGGGDVLISNGETTSSSAWNSTLLSVNPRSAVGIKADGTVVCYVVDGRSSYHSNGLTMRQLAEEMMEQGCVYALNFDGGGSSAMNVRWPGTDSLSIVNSPSDGSERRCSTYILFVTDGVSDGGAHRLGLYNDGDVVYTGSSLSLSYTAADSGYMPVQAPDDTAASSLGLGYVNGNIYTAGEYSGADTIALSSPSTGAEGTGMVQVVSWLTDITLPSSRLTLACGESSRITPSAYYYGRTAAVDASAYTYTVSGDIGTVSPDGVFTAGNKMGVSGTITVACGGAEATVRVTIPAVFTDISSHWARDYIEKLYSAGIVNGTSDTSFSPDAGIRRGDFLLMLYRAAGSPETEGESGFTDVYESDYYSRAAAWAYQNGIAAGTGDGRLSPSDSLTRQQAFTFVYRAFDVLGIDYAEEERGGALDQFSDAAEVADWAQKAAAALTEMGIVNGSGGKINPGGALTRAEMAKILCSALGM